MRFAPPLRRGEKGGPCVRELTQLAKCIEDGLAPSKATHDDVAGHVAELRLVFDTLDPDTGPTRRRRADFDEIAFGFRAEPSPIHQHMAGVMERFAPGLFVDCGDATLPCDNLDLERYFRHPKVHQRRIHGHAHAGVRIVQEGPTLLVALDAHRRHPGPFAADELIPCRDAAPPPCQRDAESRRKIMRCARSRKQRPILLADLERRYGHILGG
jgi:hypothetical protein